MFTQFKCSHPFYYSISAFVMPFYSFAWHAFFIVWLHELLET